MNVNRLTYLATAAAVLWGCTDRPGDSLKSLSPAPLPSLRQAAEAEGSSRGGQGAPPTPATPVFGRELPRGGVRLELEGTHVRVGGEVLDPASAAGAAALRARLAKGGPVLLEPDTEVYLAQALPLLAVLDDLGIQPWLLHPSGQVAFELLLRDEAAFQAWLDEPRPGKIRVIQRADGLELSTNVGKLPGPDPNGPSVPTREGRLDIATLRHGLELLRGRFKSAEDGCVVPSYGTELQKVASVLSGYFRGPDDPIFAQQCLVYPRPPSRDGGG